MYQQMVREKKKIGGGWLIATYIGQRIVHGHNNDYGQSEDIHSYQSEVNASLASPLFINTYAEFFHLKITDNIIGLCNNEAYVNKLNEIIGNPKYLKYLYKTTEDEAYKLISSIIPSNYIIHNIKAIKMMIVHTTILLYPLNLMFKQIKQRHSAHANQSIHISSPHHSRSMSKKNISRTTLT